MCTCEAVQCSALTPFLQAANVRTCARHSVLRACFYGVTGNNGANVLDVGLVLLDYPWLVDKADVQSKT